MFLLEAHLMRHQRLTVAFPFRQCDASDDMVSTPIPHRDRASLGAQTLPGVLVLTSCYQPHHTASHPN